MYSFETLHSCKRSCKGVAIVVILIETTNRETFFPAPSFIIPEIKAYFSVVQFMQSIDLYASTDILFIPATLQVLIPTSPS